jgi:hypothetical protein
MEFTLHALRRSTLIRFIATVLLLALAACSQSSDSGKPPPDKNAPRAQLSAHHSAVHETVDGDCAAAGTVLQA